jgi:Ca-activated chloride channel homolog
MRALTTLGIAALSGVLGLLLAPVPAAAQAPTQAPAPAADVAPTMLVLDASGSMTGPDPGGGTKMEAAKRAVHAFVDAVPPGSPVGLAAYGTSTGNSAAERAQGCQDVTVLQEPGPIDKAATLTAVDGLVPSGYTPIGRSLQVAAEHLPQEGPRSIVLVSDGEDTCAPPPPCKVVRTLAGQGVDLVVHAVGFGVDEVARAQLSCIAQTTGGTYTDAPDAEALHCVLPRVTATALRNYEPAGRPIAGTPGWADAPAAAPGQYLDTIGRRETRFYAVDVPEGGTAHFSATLSFPRLPGIEASEDFNGMEVRTFGADGQDCNTYESAQATDSSEGATLTISTTWTGATEAATGDAEGDPCTGGGRYYFAVSWHRVSNGVPERLPMELLVGVEPPVTDPGPAAVLPPAAFAEPAGTPAPVVGGGSFNVAGTLTGSGTFTDMVQRGEFVFYRVQLDWGQGLAYRVRFGETPGRGLDNLSPIATTLYNPFREEVESDFTSYTGSADVLPTNAPAISTVPVRYANRSADAAEVHPHSTAGWYSIAVQVAPAKEDTGTAAPVPVQLEVAVTGTAEPGPVYVPIGPVAPAGPGAPTAAAPDAVAVTPDDTTVRRDGSALTWVLLAAGGILVVVVAGLLIARLTRRR